MDYAKKKLLGRELFVLIFFVMPAICVAFVLYALFELAEVAPFPNVWSKAGHVIFFALLFGYLIRLLVKFAVWAREEMHEEDSRKD